MTGAVHMLQGLSRCFEKPYLSDMYPSFPERKHASLCAACLQNQSSLACTSSALTTRTTLLPCSALPISGHKLTQALQRSLTTDSVKETCHMQG